MTASVAVGLEAGAAAAGEAGEGAAPVVAAGGTEAESVAAVVGASTRTWDHQEHDAQNDEDHDDDQYNNVRTFHRW